MSLNQTKIGKKNLRQNNMRFVGKKVQKVPSQESITIAKKKECTNVLAVAMNCLVQKQSLILVQVGQVSGIQ